VDDSTYKGFFVSYDVLSLPLLWRSKHIRRNAYQRMWHTLCVCTAANARKVLYAGLAACIEWPACTVSGVQLQQCYTAH
jgi:hypothetical protein